jgi:beta-lactamase regulating signal transducer with metallopeptidase domain
MTAALLGALAAQSTLVAGLGLAGLWSLRHRSPLDRALWLKIAVGLLLLAPVLPRVRVPVPDAIAHLITAPAPVVAPDMPRTSLAPVPVTPVSHLPTLPVALMLAYGVGVVGLLGHLALGLGLLARWSRHARPSQDTRWQAALAASGAPAITRLLVSTQVSSPLSWGLRHPVILIDPASALRADDAPAILAHEAAHIARRDWLALMAARVAIALFWFNPLVWVLARALVQHCEEAADARALARCEPTRYAAALMACLTVRGDALLPANGMAAAHGASGHGLSRRVHQVLDAAPADLLRRSHGALATVAGVACLAVATSLVSFARAADAPAATRIVHRDGSVETRKHTADGRTTIRVVSADGRNIAITRYDPGVAVPENTPAPPMPPVPPVPPVAAIPPVPPMPPVSPAYDGGDGMLSRADVERIRADARRDAAQGMAEAARGREEANRARNEALEEARQARAEEAQARTEALAEARHARIEALAEAREARAQAMREAATQIEEARAEAHAAAQAATRQMRRAMTD